MTNEQLMQNDRFAAVNGITLIEIRKGYAKAQVKIEDKHLNGADVVHGGLLFTLADFAFAAVVNGYDNIALAVNVSISFFAKTDSGILTAEAKEISRSNKLSTCDINVTDGTGTLVANFKGTAYITGKPISEL